MSHINDLSDVKNFYCRTNINTKKCNITWKIENFAFISSGLFIKTLKSPDYVVDSWGKSSTWYLNVSLKTQVYNYTSQQYCEYVSMHLNCKDVPDSINTKFSLSILDFNNQIKNRRQIEKIFTTGSSDGFSDFVECNVLLNKENGLLQHNSLNIFCEFEFYDKETDVSETLISSTTKSYKGGLQRLSQDVVGLYNSKKFTDVTIKLLEKEFKVHKAILASRSSVFAAMFEHDCEEKATNTLTITDVEPDVMEEVINYIYSGKLNNIEMAIRVLPVADKYDLEELKEMCEHTLIAKLNVENAVSNLILGDLYNCQTLKNNTTLFIHANIRDVIISSGWKELSSHPNLALEICTRILNLNCI